jgi:hypothetical protein
MAYVQNYTKKKKMEDNVLKFLYFEAIEFNVKKKLDLGLKPKLFSAS